MVSVSVHPAEALLYDVRLLETTKVEPENPTSLPGLQSSIVNSRGLFKVEILTVEDGESGTSVRVRASFEALSSDTRLRVPNTNDPSSQQVRRLAAEKTVVLARMQASGGILEEKGLEELFPEQQQIWREWARSFALPLEVAIPRRNGMLRELSAVPDPSNELNGLKWERGVKQKGKAACDSYALSTSPEPVKSSSPIGSCLKFVAQEKLVQGPPRADQTPEAYKIRNLKAAGTAHGEGETRVQVSEKNGWLVKSDRVARRRVKLVLTKLDGSEAVAYRIDSKTRVEIRLITDSLLTQASSSPTN